MTVTTTMHRSEVDIETSAGKYQQDDRAPSRLDASSDVTPRPRIRPVHRILAMAQLRELKGQLTPSPWPR